MNNIIFAFDFSMNKPAMVSYINGKINFYIFPSDIDSKSFEKLKYCGINIHPRNLPKMKDKSLSQHELIVEHVNRAIHLADIIVSTINDILKENNIESKDNVIIANEGFAFSAKGDAALDLSGYKYILMYHLMIDGFNKFKTYSPITIKHTAGCSKRGLGKDAMIEALGKEDESLHPIISALKESPEILKKKTSYVLCMDDIADAYWCMKTCLNDNE